MGAETWCGGIGVAVRVGDACFGAQGAAGRTRSSIARSSCSGELRSGAFGSSTRPANPAASGLSPFNRACVPSSTRVRLATPLAVPVERLRASSSDMWDVAPLVRKAVTVPSGTFAAEVRPQASAAAAAAAAATVAAVSPVHRSIRSNPPGGLRSRCAGHSLLASPQRRFATPLGLEGLHSCNLGSRSSSSRSTCKSSSSSSSSGSTGGGTLDDDIVELPLFPLPLVLFPGTILPLQIFEYRYRIMMHTLMQTDMRFGVLYTSSTGGRGGGRAGKGGDGEGGGGGMIAAATIGCVGQVIRHERLPDNRFFLICRGEERFRVLEIVRTRPYLVARVQWLEDRPSGSSRTGLSSSSSPSSSSSSSQSASSISEGSWDAGSGVADVDKLADEVATVMREVIRLSKKMKGGNEKGGDSGNSGKEGSGSGNGGPDAESPLDLRKSAFPTPFSFWVASTFEGAPEEQQALLELEDTTERLLREKETLTNTLNYLTAASAVMDAFSGSSPSPGGGGADGK